MEHTDTAVLERDEPQVVVHPQPAPKQTPDTNPDMQILFEAFRL